MELARFPSRGGFSVRSIFTFAIAVLTTVILWMLFLSPTSVIHAAPEANWSGDSIVYNNHGYNESKTFKDATGTIPSGSTVYTSPIQTSGSAQKIFILFFSPGVDPPKATSAQYVEFDYKNSTTSNPQNATNVNLTVKGQEEAISSCSVEGIGWIICPVSVFLASAMDNLFNILATMIEVTPPVLSDPNNSMYTAWNVTRSIANVAFVIVFLIIIYAQLTNLQVSNYGIKKLLPRLVVAAVLVNLSFYIAALAIDVSNILGYSIQDVFHNIRDSLFHMTNDDSSAALTDTSWTTVAGVVLAGGGVIGGLYYMAGGGLYLLITLLIGLVLTALFVVIILAARQAIILILVIVAPLAFVANLLPNTEKWFGKWKDLFVTMLVFFPAFSLVFGGSQLAGQIIVQNASDNIVMLLFGLAVQVAPLVITPLLLKLSGGLLGKIAQITNDPRKGLIDRNRDWAKRRGEHARQQNISRGARFYNPSSWGSGLVRTHDFRKKRLEDNTAVWKQRATNRYNETRAYGRIHERQADADLNKDRIHNTHSAHIEHLKQTVGTDIHASAIATEISKEGLETAQNRTNAYYNRQRVVAATALSQSLRTLEFSKSSLEITDNDKNIYISQERMRRGSELNGLVDHLESSKLHLEGSQQRYTSMVDRMKLDPTNALHFASQVAQSGKDQAEAAQNRVQAMFDAQRQTEDGNILNVALQELTSSKLVTEIGQNDTEAYIDNLKNTRESLIHLQAMNAEKSKQRKERAATRLAATIDEYKSGKIDWSEWPEEVINRSDLRQRVDTMEDMRLDAIALAAEKQSVVSAQYEVQRNIADVMTGSDEFSNEMLDIAQGVGGDVARVRAQSQAVKAARSLDSDALTANVELLKNEAQRAGSNIKRYSAGIVEAFEAGLPMYDSQYITPERIKAALQAQAEEKNMPLFERIRGNSRFDQAMVNEIVALNNTNFKIAGGFGMQDDPTLNIDNFDTEDEYWHALRAQRISNLANTNAAGLASLKFGWVANSLADPTELRRNIEAALIDASSDDARVAATAKANLEAAYRTVRDALLNPDILATMNDREGSIRTVEAELARIHGQEPVPSEPLSLRFDANSYSGPDNTGDTDTDPNPDTDS